MRLFFSITLCWLLTVVAGWSQTVDVTLPSVSAVKGTEISIPIQVSDLSGVVDQQGLGVVSYQAEIHFDATKLQAGIAVNTGTLTDPWGDPYLNNSQPGKVIIGGFGTNELSGSGDLVIIKFQVIGNNGDIATLNFSYFRLNDGSIATNLTAGQVDIIEGNAAPVTDLSIIRYGSQGVQLQWSPTQFASEYHVYRGTSPYFSPDTVLAIVTETMYVDDPAAGDAATNYYYVVTAANGLGESAVSNRVGEFDFALITTPTTDFNEIALPMIIAGVDKASDLQTMITNCNSVAQWNASFQGYEQYVDWLPATDFDVYPGYPYYVNVTDNSTFTLVGNYAVPTFHLITTETTDFNEIMLLLERSDIQQASGLLQAIPNCNSVARWNASFQGYEQYVDWLPPTNFAVRVGYPYYVNITAPTTWPAMSNQHTGTTSDRIVSVSEGAYGVPHLVYGYLSEIPTAGVSDLHLRAYFTNRAANVLTESSPGTRIEQDGTFWIQCAAFEGGWKKDDEVAIEFYCNGQSEVWKKFLAGLTYNPADEARPAQIIPTRLIGDGTHPKKTELALNYPNPFNSQTTIRFELARSGHVELSIYNTVGQKIKTLVNTTLDGGRYQIVWNGTTDSGRYVSSGVYLAHLQVGGHRLLRKMILTQ